MHWLGHGRVRLPTQRMHSDDPVTSTEALEGTIRIVRPIDAPHRDSARTIRVEGRTPIPNGRRVGSFCHDREVGD
jgi:hypothetical protein